MAAPEIIVKSAPRQDTVRTRQNLTGVMALIGATQWGIPQAPTFSATFEAWIENHGGFRPTMTAAERDSYIQAQQFFAEGGEAIWTVRAHAMANNVDANALPTGVKAEKNFSRAATAATAAAITGQRQGPFTVGAGQYLDIIMDEGLGSEETFRIQNAQFILGTLPALNMTTAGTNMYLVIDGTLFTLTFTQGTGADQVPDLTSVSVSQLVSAFNAKMSALGFHTRMEVISGADYRINVADTGFSFSTGPSALTAVTDLGLTSPPESAILILPVGADTVDLTTDAGATTTLNLVFTVNNGGGASSKTVTLLASDFVSGQTDVATIPEVVAKFNTTSSTTGIRTFTEGSGVSRVMTLVVDEVVVGVAPVLTYVDGSSTANFAQASLTLDVNTTDTGVVHKNAPTSLTASQAETLFDTYLGTDIEASVESGSMLKLTHSVTGATRSIRINPDGNIFASIIGFHGNAVYGTDANVAVAAALNIKAKYEGLMGNAISVAFVQRVLDDLTLFDIDVYLDDVFKFTLQSMEMDSIVLENANDSQNYITISIPASNPSNLLPDMFGTAVALTGGTNGDVIDKQWYIGTATNKRGPFALVDLDESEWPDMLISPDMPAGTADGTEVQVELCKFAAREDVKERILAVPTFKTGLSSESFLAIIRNNANFALKDTSVAYFNAGIINNPNRKIGSITGTAQRITIPLSGTWCGITSRGDRQGTGGIHTAAAGVREGRGLSSSVLGLEILPGKLKPETSDASVRNRLSALRCNWFEETSGQVIIGDILLLGTSGNYDTVPARRGHIQLFKLMRQDLKKIQFDNVDDDSIAQGKALLERRLENMLADQGFASQRPSEAYAIDAGPGVNTPITKEAGKFVYRILTAPVKPGRFIEVLVSNLD